MDIGARSPQSEAITAIANDRWFGGAMAALRIFFGVVYLHNGLAKILPAVPGLWPDTPIGFVINAEGRRSAESIMTYEVITQPHPIEPYRAFVEQVVLPNFGFFGFSIGLLEVVVGILLILGLFTPIAALLAAGMALHLQFADAVERQVDLRVLAGVDPAAVCRGVPSRPLARARRADRANTSTVARVTDRLPPVPTFVTGGAGFIGGEVVASLLRDGAPVTVFDNLSTAEPDWSSRFDGDPGLSFVHGDITEYDVLRRAMLGHDRVVHLASGTDIVGGYGHPERDFASERRGHGARL